MKAILEMEMPGSCGDCLLAKETKTFLWTICLPLQISVCTYTNKRFVGCPLKPVEAKEVENYPEEKENRDVM